MSGTPASTSNSSPFILPELLVSLGPFLAAQDLYVCVQVCRLWNNVLMPFLWYEIDDRCFSWPTILARNSHGGCENQLQGIGSVTVWVNDLFEKYGHYIHHLSVSQLVVLQAASVATTIKNATTTKVRCPQLRSLLVFGLHVHELPCKEFVDPLALDNRASTKEQPYPGPLLSPEFGGVFLPLKEVWDKIDKQRQYWEMAQLYWILVRQNQQHIQRLHIEAPVGRLFLMVSEGFLLQSLVMLKELRSLDTGLVCIDLLKLLDHVSNLHTLRSRLTFSLTKNIILGSHQELQLSRLQIRFLELRDRLYQNEFFFLLSYLPNLEDVVLAGFKQESGLLENLQDMDINPNSLYGLHLRQIGKHDDLVLPEIIQWLPRLRRFGIGLLYPSIAKALWTYCPDLESFSDGALDEEMAVIPPGMPVSTCNTLNQLLQHCGKLKSVRAKRHSITGGCVVKHSWACRGIEVLYFQLLGVKPDTIVTNRKLTLRAAEGVGSESNDNSNDSNSAIVSPSSNNGISKELQCRELHRRIRDRLSGLGSLREIDLGEEWAEVTSSAGGMTTSSVKNK
ncbi:hypothetical protein FBU30_001115, partial [Linnemannia zychae]